MEQRYVSRTSERKNERGNVLAYTVLSALFLFLAVGLGVDLSHLYLTKAELQNAADGAALAGASALTLPEADRIEKAVDRAIEVLNLNRYNFDNRNYAAVMTLADQRNLVQFAINLDGDYVSESVAATTPEVFRFVRVQTPTVPVSIFFAMPILGTQQNLSARAIAGLSVAGNVNYCPAPLAVIDCGNLGDACVDADGNPIHLGGVCNDGGPVDNPDGTPCDPDKQLCQNCVYTIRAAPSGGPAPGNYHGLCCPEVECDAEWIRQRLAGGNNCEECPPVDPGEEITPTTKPGVNAGPIRQGINTRFDIYNGGDPPLNPTDHPPDPNIASNGEVGITYDQYLAAKEGDGPPYFESPTHDPQDGRRILILPITPYNSWNDANGRATVTVGSLGGFFLQRKIGNGTDGTLRAEYIGDRVVSGVGFDAGGPNPTNVVTVVLYR